MLIGSRLFPDYRLVNNPQTVASANTSRSIDSIEIINLKTSIKNFRDRTRCNRINIDSRTFPRFQIGFSKIMEVSLFSASPQAQPKMT